MSKLFKKGERVYLVRDWDHRGTAHVMEVIVQSCGVKQMHLTEANGMNHEHRYYVEHINAYDYSPRVMRCADVADISATALQIAAEYRRHHEAHLDRCLKSYGHESPGYAQAIERDRAKLHEPRVIFQELKA